MYILYKEHLIMPRVSVTPGPFQLSAFCPCFQVPVLVKLSVSLPFNTLQDTSTLQDVSNCDNDFSVYHYDITNSSNGMSTCFNGIMTSAIMGVPTRRALQFPPQPHYCVLCAAECVFRCICRLHVNSRCVKLQCSVAIVSAYDHVVFLNLLFDVRELVL